MKDTERENESKEIMQFDKALEEYESGKYAGTEWCYIPDHDEDYRYVLWNKGENKEPEKTLIVVGVNPSKATPEELDRTVDKMFKIAQNNGYDSVMVLNLYPQRATDPEDMDEVKNDILYNENLKAFRWAFSKARDVWVAWGNIVNTRRYLQEAILDIFAGITYCGKNRGIEEAIRDWDRGLKKTGTRDLNWKKLGKITKKGHPRHPLYQKIDLELSYFDMDNYVDELKKRLVRKRAVKKRPAKKRVVKKI